MKAIPRIPVKGKRVGLGPTEGPSNNRMNLTRSAQQTDHRGPCRLSECSTDVDEPTATAVGTSKRISDFVGCTEILVGSAPSNLRGGYGGIPVVASCAQVGTMGIPWSGWIGPGGAWLGREHPEEQVEALGTTSTPSNNGLKWTRSASLPLGGPRHLTRCCTHV